MNYAVNYILYTHDMFFSFYHLITFQARTEFWFDHTHVELKRGAVCLFCNETVPSMESGLYLLPVPLQF